MAQRTSSGRFLLLLLALVLLGAAALIAGIVVTGYSRKPPPPTAQPLVAPPAIGTAGVLRVAIDPTIPPFAGTEGGRQAGYDIDVASALAARLGLTVKTVSVEASDVASALSAGSADIALGGLPISSLDLGLVAVAGSYGSDGPVFFSAKAEPASLETLGLRRVAAQYGSAAFWKLEGEFGEGSVASFPSLRSALLALTRGEVDLVAGDAFIGAYIMREMPDVTIVGQVAPATPLGVLVAKDAVELEELVRTTLDAMATDGTLEALRQKWVPGIPELASDLSSSAIAPATEATPAP